MARMIFEVEGAEIPDFLMRMAAAFAVTPARTWQPVQGLHATGEAQPVTASAPEPVAPAADAPAPRRPGRPRGTGKTADPVDQYNDLANAAGAATVPTEAPLSDAELVAIADSGDPDKAAEHAAELRAGLAEPEQPAAEAATPTATEPDPAADPEAVRQALLAEVVQPVRDRGVEWITHFITGRFKIKRMSEMTVEHLLQVKADLAAGLQVPA